LKRLNDIRPLIENGEVVLFFGAGMSAMAGCWTWRKLVRELLKHPVMHGKLGLNPDPQSRLEEIIGFCKEEFDRGGQSEEFQEIVGNTTKVELEKYTDSYKPIIERITAALTPLPKVITTNIDDCLDYTYCSNRQVVYSEIQDLSVEKFELKGDGIFHLHGHKRFPEHVVFTLEEYLRRYNNPKFKEFLSHVFSQKTVLFLGYGLMDNELNRIMQEVKYNQSSKPIPIHYALVPNEDNVTHDRCSILRRNSNLEVIEYGKIEEFAQVIGDWLNEMSVDKLIEPPKKIQ
jgi:hypothetical protein